jgi:hypothetical protein
MTVFRCHPSIFLEPHNSPTALVTRLWDGQSAVQIQAVAIFLSSPKCPDQLWGPPSLLFDGQLCLSQGVKWLGREFDHLPPSGAEGEE